MQNYVGKKAKEKKTGRDLLLPLLAAKIQSYKNRLHLQFPIWQGGEECWLNNKKKTSFLCLCVSVSVLVVDVVADVVTCCADTYNCLCEQISSTPSSLLSFTRSEEKNKKKNCCSGVWSISGTKILAALWSRLW